MKPVTEKKKIDINTAYLTSHDCTLLEIIKPPNATWAHYQYRYQCPKGHISSLEHRLLRFRKNPCTICSPNTGMGSEITKTETLPKILRKKNLHLISVYKNALTPITVKCQQCNFQFSILYSSLAHSKSDTPCPSCRGHDVHPASIVYSQIRSNQWTPQTTPTNTDHYIGGKSSIALQCNLCNKKWNAKVRYILKKNSVCPGCANGKCPEDAVQGLIYKATGPTGKVYIGQTIQTLSERYKSHRNDHTNPDTASYHYTFAAATRKHGFDSFKWEILHARVSWNKLDDLEIEEIKKHNSYHEGYNSTEGGQGAVLAEQAIKRYEKFLSNEQKCYCCKEVKDLSDFCKDNSKETGRRGLCKACRCVQRKAQYKKAIKLEKKRKLRDFHNSLKKEIKLFLRTLPTKDAELKEMQLNVKRSVNAKKRAKNKPPKESKYIGVCLSKTSGKKWKANIKHQGKKIHLGVFRTEEEAAKAYDEAVKQYRGKGAKVNFP